MVESTELSDPNTNWRLHLALVAFGMGAVWVGGLAALLAIPVFAWVVSRWIVMAIGFIKARADRDATHDWNGRYFAHDGTQVRVYWDEERLWIVATDVFEQLGIEADAVERGKIAIRLKGGLERISGGADDGFSEQGVLEFLGRRREPEAHKLRLWIERTLIPNIGHSRERGELHLPGGA